MYEHDTNVESVLCNTRSRTDPNIEKREVVASESRCWDTRNGEDDRQHWVCHLAHSVPPKVKSPVLRHSG